jgi:hypothetical protein
MCNPSKEKEYYKGLTFQLQACRISQGIQFISSLLAKFLMLQCRDFFSRTFQELAPFPQTPPNVSYSPEVIIIRIDFQCLNLCLSTFQLFGDIKVSFKYNK